MSEELMQPPAQPMKKSMAMVVRVCDEVIRWTILSLAALVPVFVLPWTLEVAEVNKQLLILLGGMLAGMAWLGKMLAERKFEYRKSPVNVMVVLFAAVYAISSWLSYSPYMSIMGDFGQEKAGLATLVSMVVIYFVTANNFRTVKEIRTVALSAMIGGAVAATYAVLQGLGLYVLPFEFAKSASFNTVGTASALGLYMVFVTALASGLLLLGHRDAGKPTMGDRLRTWFSIVTGVLGLFIIIQVDFWPVTVCLAVSAAILIGFAFLHASSVKGMGGVALPIAAFILSLLMLVLNYPTFIKYPAEVMPSSQASWDITMKTLREKPFFGSGPGTFIFDYAKHRSAEVNATSFWNLRFDRASTRFMTMLATTGLLGALTWLLMALFMLFAAARRLFKADEETWHVLIALFAAWVPLVLARFVYSSTIALEFAFWISMGLLFAAYKREQTTVRFDTSPRAAMAVSFVFILGVVFSLTGMFVAGTRYAGEIAYASAIRIDRAGGNVDDVVSNLSRATGLNGNNDVFIRNLALANLAKADKMLSEEVKVDRKEGEKDEDYNKRVADAKQEVVKEAVKYTNNAVTAAKATTAINGKNVANWSVLGSVYTNLMGVSTGADEFAAAAYLQAIELEPANPILRTELGKIYMYQGDLVREAASKLKDEAKTEADKKATEITDKAIEAFNKAIELKGDYAAARYNLAIALDREGKLKEAVSRMEETVTINPQDVGVGFQLALMYYRDDRKDEAIRMMEQVVGLSPKFSNARWYLAAMYEEKGKLDLAIAQLKEVQALNADNDLVKRKLDELTAKKNGSAAPAAPATPAVGPDGKPLPAPVTDTTKTPTQPEVKAPATR
jgi:tetratricopeptide (TPR) repeat protein